MTPSNGMNISPLMSSIENAALSQARNLISQRLRDPSSREEVAYMRAQLKKELVTIDSQLNHSVQNKLDAMKRAVEIMSDSAEKVKNTYNHMRKIDNKIESTNTTISNFSTLKRVHYARENLRKVITQVEFFARVPDKVSEMLTMLEEEPHRIKVTNNNDKYK